MKKLFILILLSAVFQFSWAQSCARSCDKKSCGPEGTKKAEAAVITTMRTDVQTVLTKMSQSNVSFDKQVADMKIEKGESDDESLLFLSQAVTAIRYELTSRLDASKQIAALKEFKPASASSRQQMVASLKKEIQLLASQAEKL
jgi:K+ transporter